jgi:hypothetical protein
LFIKLLKTAAILTSLPLCGFIFFLLISTNDASVRTYQYLTSNLNGSTKGKIVNAEILRGGEKIRHNYHRITYTYVVNGKQYFSDLFNFKERSFGNSKEIVSQYPPGKETLVWYDKDSPEIGVLEKSGPTPDLIFLSTFQIFIACAGFLLNPLMWIAFGDKYKTNRYQR